jgi:hypothetical protein
VRWCGENDGVKEGVWRPYSGIDESVESVERVESVEVLKWLRRVVRSTAKYFDTLEMQAL